MLLPDYENMTHLESKLFSIYQKEGTLNEWPLCGKLTISSLPVGQATYTRAMKWITNVNLCKHFRDMLVLEEYETAAQAKKELEARGYEIQILENSIKFIPR